MFDLDNFSKEFFDFDEKRTSILKNFIKDLKNTDYVKKSEAQIYFDNSCMIGNADWGNIGESIPCFLTCEKHLLNATAYREIHNLVKEYIKKYNFYTDVSRVIDTYEYLSLNELQENFKLIN
jgi:hypothetical protein